MRHRAAAVLAAAVLGLVAIAHAAAQLRGHGGPVRAIALAADGRTLISGGFDQSAILWDIERDAASAVLRFHEGAVNAVAALPDGSFASGGEDGRIAVWRLGDARPLRIFAEHSAPIAGLAASRDGGRIASAAWDGTVRVRPATDGAARVLEGHQGNVNAVAFLPDGRIVSAGYDGTVRLWRTDGGAAVPIPLGGPVNAIAVLPDGRVTAGKADGVVQFIGTDGALGAGIAASGTPITGLAASSAGDRLAAATIGGEIVLIDLGRGIVLRRIGVGGGPVWAVTFRPMRHEVLSAGGDGVIRRWNSDTGEPIGAAAPGAVAATPDAGPGDRGADLFRACAACHVLGAAAGGDPNGNRAGPSLHGVFGRRIATAPGYNFSEALKQLDIVWNAETIARLFEIGPSRYTPGSKMPDQIISDAVDRDALVRFLERATADR